MTSALQSQLDKCVEGLRMLRAVTPAAWHADLRFDQLSDLIREALSGVRQYGDTPRQQGFVSACEQLLRDATDAARNRITGAEDTIREQAEQLDCMDEQLYGI